MTSIRAQGFPEQAVRDRARRGIACAFPPLGGYGADVFGAREPTAPCNAESAGALDALKALRLVPPVFMPQRLQKLIELGREPLYSDVAMDTLVGGFRSPLPLFVCPFGSTRVAATGLGSAVSRQAGRLGIPMVIGENLVPTAQLRRDGQDVTAPMLARLKEYAAELPEGDGGVVIQQSTEDADAEVWNLFYSHPGARSLLDSGRLGFELKLGQGAKPGIGGLVLLDGAVAEAAAHQFATEGLGPGAGPVLRSSSPGTVTEEIMRQQIHLMRNNFPRARVWVKLQPARDVADAAAAAIAAGADAVTVDGAEAGTGWAPAAFLDHVGLPLAECLIRLHDANIRTLASGRMWEGTRPVKAIALGALAVGLGRAALIAADENPQDGLCRLVACMDFEMRLLISALGKYSPAALGDEDLWPDLTKSAARAEQAAEARTLADGQVSARQ